MTPNTQITQANVGLYERAVMFATRDKPSTSYLQRRLEISYHQATALMERMQREGLISAANPGTNKREILVPYTDRPALSPPAEDHIGDATEKVDWERVGPKLVEALEGLVERVSAEGIERARASLAAAKPQPNGE